jgi:hypothetical protein
MTENMTTLLELIEHMESDLRRIKAIAAKLQSGRGAPLRKYSGEYKGGAEGGGISPEQLANLESK